jgi:RNAse (barnase) inhibitor barstar
VAPFAPDGTGPDFPLFANGPVVLFHDRAVLAATTSRLADLGYLVHRFDAAAWATKADFAAAVKRELAFPAHFGGNLDAFDDCLRAVATRPGEHTGTALVFTGYDAFATHEPRTAQAVLDIVADNARFAMLFGHRVTCLVQTDDPTARFTPVGATGVTLNPGEGRR